MNPVLSDFEGEEEGIEGCLSIPGMIGDVKRAAACTMPARTGMARNSAWRRAACSRAVFKHEVDHLDGILIIDKATNIRDAAVVQAGDAQAAKAAREVSI